MVEVFKTNVEKENQAEMVKRKLLGSFPGSDVHFDLSDRDKILRIESQELIPEEVIFILRSGGFSCEILLE